MFFLFIPGSPDTIGGDATPLATASQIKQWNRIVLPIWSWRMKAHWGESLLFVFVVGCGVVVVNNESMIAEIWSLIFFLIHSRNLDEHRKFHLLVTDKEIYNTAALKNLWCQSHPVDFATHNELYSLNGKHCSLKNCNFLIYESFYSFSSSKFHAKHLLS